MVETRDLEERSMGIAANHIGSNLVIFCYKEFEKFELCKCVSQSEATLFVYSDPITTIGHVNIIFYNDNSFKM